MPYGVSAQGVLNTGASSPRNGDARKSSSSSSFKMPGFGSSGGGSSSGGGGGGGGGSGGGGKGNHFGGEARATSSSFTGVMYGLLKPSRPPAAGTAAATAAKPEESLPARPQAQFRPRSALDLSGHSFSKTMKAEISRSKLAKTNEGAAAAAGGGGGIPKHGWWDRSGGLGMDDSLSRPPSTRNAASYAAESARSSHLRVPSRAPRAAEGGGSALQHRQRVQQSQQQQQQQSMSMCRPRTYGESCLDELSRAVGLQ